MFARQFSQGVQQFGHLLRGDLDLVENLIPIQLELIGLVEKLGIGHNRGKRVPQIV